MKILLFLCFLCIHFSLYPMLRSSQHHQSELEERYVTDGELAVRLAYNKNTETIFATFVSQGHIELENTFAEKNRKTQQFSSNASQLYFPSCGSPFYIPKQPDPVLVNKLKSAIKSYEAHLAK